MSYTQITNVKRLNDDAMVNIDHNGEVLAIDFWATWCPPCQKPMAHNQAMLEKNGKRWGSDVRIIGIAVDQDIAAVRKRVKEAGWGAVEHYFRGASRCSAEYGISGIPHMIIVDKCGNIHWRGHPGSADVEGMIEKCLASDECKMPQQNLAMEKQPAVSP